jgi:hypothetical protein
VLGIGLAYWVSGDQNECKKHHVILVADSDRKKEKSLKCCLIFAKGKMAAAHCSAAMVQARSNARGRSMATGPAIIRLKKVRHSIGLVK